MVLRSAVRLAGRVPVIQFRKGGLQPAAGAPHAASATPQGQQRATVSTGVIEDTQLPPRYQRRPLSQEEIDYINGGGIV